MRCPIEPLAGIDDQSSADEHACLRSKALKPSPQSRARPALPPVFRCGSPKKYVSGLPPARSRAAHSAGVRHSLRHCQVAASGRERRADVSTQPCSSDGNAQDHVVQINNSFDERARQTLNSGRGFHRVAFDADGRRHATSPVTSFCESLR